MTPPPSIPEAEELASELLALAGANRLAETTDLVWQVWATNPPLLAMAMSIWYFVIQDRHGVAAVDKGVETITDQMHNAPVESPVSRLTFCEMLYALQDENPIRMHTAWAKLLEAEDWLAANEVVGLMLSFVGYYLGWFGEEGFLYEQA